MQRAQQLLDAAWGVCVRDFALFRTYPMRGYAMAFSSVVSLTLFYYISRLVHARDIGSPAQYYAFVVIGMVTLSILTSTLVTPLMTLRQEVLTGTFERMVLSPFGPVRCILALMLFPLLTGYATSLFTVAFAGVAFGLSLHWATAALAIPIALLGALAFAPFGLLMATGVILFKQTRGGSTFAVTAVTVVSGIYFPSVLLPHWLRWLSDVQPFSPAVELLRHELVGTALTEPVWLSLVKLIGFPLLLMPLGALMLDAAVETVRRRGTLIEY